MTPFYPTRFTRGYTLIRVLEEVQRVDVLAQLLLETERDEVQVLPLRRGERRERPRQLRQFCRLDRESLNLLKSRVNEMGLSARAHDKVLRVARTIADLAESDAIRLEHVQEAINYPMLDRQMWT